MTRLSPRTMTAMRCLIVPLLTAGAIGAYIAPASANDTSRVVKAVTTEGIKAHLKALMEIAKENDGTRAAGTPGYKASVDYVRKELNKAGYDVEVQPFDFTLFVEKKPPVFKRLGENPVTYKPGEDILTMEYSGSGDVTGMLVPADGIVIPPTPNPSSASGCEEDDFPAETSGNIALIQRGTCDFVVKVENAAKAGAIAAIVFNEGNANYPERIGLFSGTLGRQVTIPALSASFAVGEKLFDEAGRGFRYRVAVEASFETTKTFNVIGTSKQGNPREAVVVGAHLDSVQAGPGMNDNGSGSATILEIARQISFQRITPKNQLRFAFWGAEEEGLFGSEYYVGALSKGELKKISLNLNFDMMASPNYVRFVYDGNGSDGDAGPPGSEEIERIFNQYYAKQDLPTAPTAFDGRSDYGPFIAAGIPAGGLFAGAEEIKTKQQARLFGGEAGVALDKCYHLKCDNLGNINEKALIELGRGAAHATMIFAMRDPFERTPEESADIAALADRFDYKGPKLKR